MTKKLENFEFIFEFKIALNFEFIFDIFVKFEFNFEIFLLLDYFIVVQCKSPKYAKSIGPN